MVKVGIGSAEAAVGSVAPIAENGFGAVYEGLGDGGRSGDGPAWVPGAIKPEGEEAQVAVMEEVD